MITASIVTYHTNPNEVIQLVSSLINNNVNHIYIIDNSSNDLLRNYIAKFDQLTYIHSKNIGYGNAHNIAIKESFKLNNTYHIIVNPDIIIPKNDTIDKLKKFMDSTTTCGLVMPLILYPNNEIQYLCKLLPSPKDLLIRRFLPSFLKNKNIDYKYELRYTKYNQVMEVPSLSGCFMFIRADILKEIGGFDKRFFMYAEDLDLCRRIGRISKTIFYPYTYVFHKYEKGSYKNFKLLKYHIISIIKYFNKWGWFFDKERKLTNQACIEKFKKTSLNK